MAIDCTTDGLLRDNYKCFACLSPSELLAVAVIVVNELTGEYNLPEELADLLKDSACWTCVPDTKMVQGLVSALAQKAYSRSNKTIEEIRDEIKCLLCAPPANVKAALTLLLCKLTDGYTAPA